MAKFEINDIVKLKSGGPPMTVNSVSFHTDKRIDYSCTWFPDSKNNMAHFPEATLEIYEETKTDGWGDI